MRMSTINCRNLRLCTIAALLVLMIGTGIWVTAAEARKSKRSISADELFSAAEVPRLKIEISPEGMKTLEKYHWQFGPQGERESVKATVREGNRSYLDVALHLKGAAGSFRAVNENPALTLNFDKFVKGQNFHGLTKLSLNNSVQDPSFVSEQLCREIFLKAGVPVPRTTHAVVELNGRPLGLYVLAEGFDRQFLKQHFKNPDGNLYDGGFLKDVDQELALNSGENPKDQSDRAALAEAAREADPGKRLERLQKTLDLDRFLTYIALDVMLWDWDGYPQNKNNWRLYHDPAADKMVFIPHGLDQMFWKPEGSLLPEMKGLVAKAVLGIPELRARYFERVKQLRAGVFNPQQMTNRVHEISAKIAPLIKDADVAREQATAAATLSSAIIRRGRSIDEQLANPIDPIKFDGAGFASLARWESKSDFGHPSLDRAPAPDAKECLHLGTTSGSSIGSWKTRVWLEQGKYRVEARVKTRGIVPDAGDSRPGAGLRVGNSRSEQYVKATADWTPVSYEFAVGDALGEVQILCEFRGAEGEAWFDLSSLRLSRVVPAK